VNRDPFAGYPAGPADETVDPAGRLRNEYAGVGETLRRLGEAGFAARAAALEADRSARGVVLSTWADGRRHVRPFPLDPLPRVVPAEEWGQVAAGAEQRHRALNAFLADAYRAAGRRRGDADRAPEIVRAGALPEWAVAHSPARDPDAVGLAWPGQPRVTLAATDVLRTAGGDWLATRDSLRAPSGIGYAVAARDGLRRVLPELFGNGRPPADPRDAVALLRAGLAAAAPPACTRPPRIAVLTAGESDGAWFEHRLLAGALEAPLVGAADLWPRVDGGLEVEVDGRRLPVDVVYRRFDDAALGVYRTAAGGSLEALLAEAVRAGRLGVANVPGNGLADDAAAYAWVPAMIRFYLGEEPLLGSRRTWVLADERQWAQVRDRLHELVLEPVAGYGGGRTVVGPSCTAAELAQLQREVAAAPHRFVAQEPVEGATVPVWLDGRLQPRPADLRVFTVVGPGGEPRALPAPLTRVGHRADAPVTEPGDGSKDTWLVP
jgi:carboxylate-amine ligase